MKRSKFIKTWNSAKIAYIKKDRQNPIFFITNACGSPPKEASKLDGWPQRSVISDSKTSAGMDRTDDIKKAVYQVLKIGITHQSQRNYKTAIISNLPAYRHQDDYVRPFVNVLWGNEADIESINNKAFISREKLNYIFDYIITLDDTILRGDKI
ncbi:hypothetical protein AwWohl_07860 [Gammaproteobacteria bacterium]|nr:hypothetical protein AwWohl_07860 [Gammaproteobacteria bacterium]